MDARGYAAQSADSPLGPFEFERRSPGDRDVQIEIEFCGVCHTDIHFTRNDWGMTPYPCVPGHEIVGRVVATGKEATGKFREGQRVAVGCLVGSCRTCGSCHNGRENYCANGFTMTYGSMDIDGKTPTFGGYSNRIVADEHFVLSVPENLDPAGAAPLLCAGITTYSPLRRAGIGKGSKVAIMGLGGLGHMGVKFAAASGAEVAVFSRSPEKQADAKRLGAHEFVLTTSDDALDKLAGRYDVILDTVASKHDLTGPLTCLRLEGSLVLLGVAAESLEFNAVPLIFGGRKIESSMIGGIPETQEMLDFCGEHNIECDVEVIRPEQINTAYERVLRGEVKYRFVIDCSKF